MRRFFIPNIPNIGHIDLDSDLKHRIIDVLRCNEGEELEILDGNGRLAKVVVLGKGKNIFLNIKEVKDMIGISMSRINLPIADLEPLVHNLNGFIIMPADSFSLNLIILPKSMIFTDSSLNLVNDTLRRALSQAGLKYVEQQAGFINNLEHPVLVTALIDGNNLIIKIFGCQTEEGKEILFVTEKKEIPPQMQVKVNKKLTPQQRTVIQEGQSGYINRSYRVVKIKGKETEKTLLSEEFTPGWDTIITVGPGTIKK